MDLPPAKSGTPPAMSLAAATADRTVFSRNGSVVRSPAPLLHVGKLVPERGDTLVRQPLCRGLHEAVAHAGTGSVPEDEEAAGLGRLEEQSRDLAGTLRGLEAVLAKGVQRALRLRSNHGTWIATENRVRSQSRWSMPPSVVSSSEIVKRSSISGSDDVVISTVAKSFAGS